MIDTVLVVILVYLATTFVNTLLRHDAEEVLGQTSVGKNAVVDCVCPSVSPRIVLRLRIFWKSRYVRALAPAEREA